MRLIKPNQHAPQLYADRLALEVTLVNLPGAALPESSWQLSYRLFFVAEQEFEQVAKVLGRGRDNLTPEKFPGRIALAAGEFTRKPLAALADRRFERAGIVFKSKIPDARRTSFASLLLFYSTKIFDARLQQTFYKTGVFIMPPFDEDNGDGPPSAPRTRLFLNIYLDENGKLYDSRLPRAGHR